MKEKKVWLYVSIIAFAIAVAFLGVFLYKENIIKKKIRMAVVSNQIQSVYDTLIWAELCKTNKISYSEESLNKIKELYEAIISSKKLDKESGAALLDYSYIVCLNSLLNLSEATNKSFIKIMNDKYYNDDIQMYTSALLTQNLLADGMNNSILNTQMFQWCGVQDVKDCDKGLNTYLDEVLALDNLDEDDFIDVYNVLIYFWKKNNCKEINLNNEKIKQVCFSIFQTSYIEEQFYLDVPYFDLWLELDFLETVGIDVSSVRKKAEEMNLFDYYMSFNIYEDMSNMSAIFTTSIYKPLLEKPNVELEKYPEFLAGFGKALNNYMDSIVIPELNNLYCQYFK